MEAARDAGQLGKAAGTKSKKGLDCGRQGGTTLGGGLEEVRERPYGSMDENRGGRNRAFDGQFHGYVARIKCLGPEAGLTNGVSLVGCLLRVVICHHPRRHIRCRRMPAICILIKTYVTQREADGTIKEARDNCPYECSLTSHLGQCLSDQFPGCWPTRPQLRISQTALGLPKPPAIKLEDREKSFADT